MTLAAPANTAAVYPDAPDTYDAETLVAWCLPTARYIARSVHRSSGGSLEFDELLGLAYLGLATAAAKWIPYCQEHGYDPARTEYFRTYASRRMRGAILDALRSADWVTRTQRTIVKRAAAAGFDDTADPALVSATIGYGPAEITAAYAAVSHRPGSLEGLTNADGHIAEAPHSLIDPDATASPVTSVTDAAMHAISAMPPMAQVVLALRYYAERTLTEIAELLGRSDNEISRIHAEAVITVHAAMLTAATPLLIG